MLPFTFTCLFTLDYYCNACTLSFKFDEDIKIDLLLCDKDESEERMGTVINVHLMFL